MSTIDTNRPYIAYTLLTSCGCEKTVLYQRSDGGILISSDGEWSPHEPHLETDFVDIEKNEGEARGGQGEISGDAHRHIEGSGQMEAFILALFDGESIEAAVRRFAGDLA